MGPHHQHLPASGECGSVPERTVRIHMASMWQKWPYSSTCSCCEFASLILYELLSVFNLFSNSVQFNRSVVSNSLQSHEPQHTRPHCASPTPRVQPNPRPLSRWCHPTISTSVVPFSSCPQSFPASGSFQMSQLFTSGGQSIGVSASASVPPMNTQDWSFLGGLVRYPCSPRDSQESSPTPSSKASILQC